MRYSLFLIGFLAGCGGGGVAPPVDPIDELPKTITPEINVAPTGTASYRGPTTLGFTPASATAVTLNGTMNLNVNFDSAAVTGDASNYTTAIGAPVEGVLYLSSGMLDDSGTTLQFDSQIAGSLRAGTDAYLIAGAMNGEFLGADETAVSGRITGTAYQAGIPSTMSGTFQVGRAP